MRGQAGALGAVSETQQNEVRSVPVGSIRPNPRQPRQVFDEDALDELVASIAEIGLLQPLVVRPDTEGSGYELVAGERRLRSVQRLGWEQVPVLVRPTDDIDLLRDALLENLHRSDLNPLEEAAAYQQLLADFGCTQDELSSRVGRSRPQISNTIRLLRLPPAVQRRVAAGVLSQGHARALLALPTEEAMEGLHRVCPTVHFLGSYPRADKARPVVGHGFTDEEFDAAARWIRTLG